MPWPATLAITRHGDTAGRPTLSTSHQPVLSPEKKYAAFGSDPRASIDATTLTCFAFLPPSRNRRSTMIRPS